MFFMYGGGLNAVNAAEGYHDSSTTIQYFCDSVTDFEMPVVIKSKVPTTVTPGEEFILKDSSTTVTLPEKVVDTLRGLLQAESISGEATKFNILAENNDAVVNVAKNPIPIPETAVPESGTLTFTVPGSGGVDAGPFTAGNEGEVTIKAGAIDTNLVVHGGLGSLPIAAACTPVEGQDLTLNKISIEEAAVEDTVAPEITLSGENPMELEVGQTYEEPGAKAEDNVDGDLTDQIKVSGEVDTSKAGENTVTYTVTDTAGNTATKTRTVNVVEPAEEPDTEEPVITLNGENPMELEVGQTYEEPGAKAEDNVDGDLTDQIKVSSEVDTSKAGKYTVTYTVTDEAGNTATKTRTVNVVEPAEEPDTEEPVITLNGENPMELQVGDKYEEPGAKAEDNVDGDLTDQIKVSGEVDTSKAGEYTITYTVSDKAGNEATALRTVNVVEADEPGEPGDGDNGNNPGGEWFTGEGAPSADLGDKGDLYLDEETGEFYKKSSDGWELRGTLKGEDGENGQDGQPGEDGENGQDGQPGEDGQNGATWLVGEGEPAGESGVIGDLYLDKVSADVYLKGENGWELVTNIRGEQGPEGDCNCDNKDNASGIVGGDDDNNYSGSNTSNDSVEKSSDSSVLGGGLPKTASSTPLLILLGSLMAIAGGSLIFIRKKVLN